MKLSILVPVYNERNTIDEIIRRIAAVKYEKEVILVDDDSGDGTKERLKEIQSETSRTPLPSTELKFEFHDRNRGKGAAIRTALTRATGDVYVIQDADLEYDPQEYSVLLQPILDGRADVVYGSRFMGGPHRVLFFWHYMANKFLTLVSNMLTNLNLSDTETCYKLFTAQVGKQLNLRSDRFDFDPEVTARFSKLKCRIYEVPISYSGRTYAEGKKIRWTDGFVCLRAILRFNLFPPR